MANGIPISSSQKKSGGSPQMRRTPLFQFKAVGIGSSEYLYLVMYLHTCRY